MDCNNEPGYDESSRRPPASYCSLRERRAVGKALGWTLARPLILPFAAKVAPLGRGSRSRPCCRSPFGWAVLPHDHVLRSRPRRNLRQSLKSQLPNPRFGSYPTSKKRGSRSRCRQPRPRERLKRSRPPMQVSLNLSKISKLPRSSTILRSGGRSKRLRLPGQRRDMSTSCRTPTLARTSSETR